MGYKKIGVLGVACCIGLIALTVSYGYWNDHMQVNGQIMLRMYANINIAQDEIKDETDVRYNGRGIGSVLIGETEEMRKEQIQKVEIAICPENQQLYKKLK